MSKTLIVELPSRPLDREKMYFVENEPKCGFDEKEPCTKECKWFDTCTRNPIWLKEGEKNERDSKRIPREDLG